MTLAPDGAREMTLMTLVLGGAALALGWWHWPVAIVPLLLLLSGLAFFRSPYREIPGGPNLLVSPADGKVTEITRLDHDELVGGPAVRIGIFLSVFDVHVNRIPCDAKVLRADYRRGEFLDARHPESGHRNEAMTLVLEPSAPYPGPIVVRQIAGLIARRIVCNARVGQHLQRGDLFGLIKFGSRTELIVPADAGYEPAVRIGQHVAGGATILMKLTVPADQARADHGRDRENRPEAAAPTA